MSPTTLSSDAETFESSVRSWLRTLRWFVAFAMTGIVVVSHNLLSLEVRLIPAIVGLVGLLGLAAFGGKPLVAKGVRSHDVVLDIVLIAIVLASSGGAANPFSAILLVYVALASSLLPLGRALAIAGLAALAFGAMFAVPNAHAACEAALGPRFRDHLYGMWAAFALGAAMVAFVLANIRHAAKKRDAQAAELRDAARLAEKFTALATLAAGAAHELATPLGTIAIDAREIATDATDDITRRRAETIVSEVERCRDVLLRMRPGATVATAPGAKLITSVESAVESWRRAHPTVTLVVRTHSDAELPLATQDVEAALGVLLDNADEAAHGSPILVNAGADRRGPYVTVEDEGVGISDEALPHLGEPFFTTKEPSGGMGLGLFVVRSLLRSRGGSLEVERRTTGGTCVRLRFTDTPTFVGELA